MRRFGEAVVRGQSYRRRAGAYAILRDGDAVLVTHQAAPVPEFQLPGGGIDPGESPVQALHREVMEETGWTIAIDRRLGAYRRFTWMPDYEFWAEKVCTVYLARPILRRGPPGEPGHSAHWMTIAEAAEMLGTEGDRHFMAGLL